MVLPVKVLMMICIATALLLLLLLLPPPQLSDAASKPIYGRRVPGMRCRSGCLPGRCGCRYHCIRMPAKHKAYLMVITAAARQVIASAKMATDTGNHDTTEHSHKAEKNPMPYPQTPPVFEGLWHMRSPTGTLCTKARGRAEVAMRSASLPLELLLLLLLFLVLLLLLCALVRRQRRRRGGRCRTAGTPVPARLPALVRFGDLDHLLSNHSGAPAASACQPRRRADSLDGFRTAPRRGKSRAEHLLHVVNALEQGRVVGKGCLDLGHNTGLLVMSSLQSHQLRGVLVRRVRQEPLQVVNALSVLDALDVRLRTLALHLEIRRRRRSLSKPPSLESLLHLFATIHHATQCSTSTECNLLPQPFRSVLTPALQVVTQASSFITQLTRRLTDQPFQVFQALRQRSM